MSFIFKVSITAVAKLLQHGVNTNDSRLTEITVRGDQVLRIPQNLCCYAANKGYFHVIDVLVRFSVKDEPHEVQRRWNSGQRFLCLQSC